VGHGQGTRYSDCVAKRPVPDDAAPRRPPAVGAEAYLKISPPDKPGKRPGAIAVTGTGTGTGTRIGTDSGSGSGVGAVAVAAGALAGSVLAGAVLAWSAWRVWRSFERVEVSGPSMVPSLQPGDRVLVWRTRSVRPGDIVAASDPRRPERSLLKRVVDVGQEGVFLLGDNLEHSTDSRQFGPVPMASVRGKAIYRYAPPARAGKLL
jgi:nickel-type superoxide dismutase maturation protease